MKTCVSLAALCFAGLASSALAGPPGEWYGGDPDLVNGLSSETDTFTPGYISTVYEDFDHLGGDITDIWGNFFSSTKVQAVDWEIRQGMSPGNGGTVIASGRDTPVVFQNGFDAFNFLGYHIDLDIPDISDPGVGTYWVGMSVVGDNTGRVFVQTSSGSSSIGTPQLNHNALFNSPNVFGANFDLASNQGQVGDYSLGVNARTVPAPASAALLGLGGLAAARRRRA